MEKINSLVSIILPVYNRERYLERALESVFAQSYPYFELLVIDDGSTDGTVSLVRRYVDLDPRVRVLHDNEHKGLVKRLNEGVRAARGEYITRLDDDDFWHDKEKLRKQVEFLRSRSGYILVGGGQIRVDEHGNERVRYLFPETDEQIRKTMLQANPFAHTSVMFLRSAWEEVGGYDEKLDFSEDWDLWLRFGKIGKFHNLQEYLVTYLQAGQNRSNVRLFSNATLNLKIRSAYRTHYPYFWKGYLIGILSLAAAFPLLSFIRIKVLKNYSYWRTFSTRSKT